jgi:hypothetical protein
MRTSDLALTMNPLHSLHRWLTLVLVVLEGLITHPEITEPEAHAEAMGIEVDPLTAVLVADTGIQASVMADIVVGCTLSTRSATLLLHRAV